MTGAANNKRIGRRSQDSLTTSPHPQPALTQAVTGKSGFEENNTSGAAKRRSAAYNEVREHPSIGRRSQNSLTTRFPIGIYVHWPFCLTKCPYCDFYSSAARCKNENELINEYCRDLEYYRALNNNYEVRSIFFGGGTPSLLSQQNIARLIDKITGLWPCRENLEISLEANPNSRKPELFKDLKSAGINRLSLGIQALNETDLKFLGRTHTLAEALEAVEEIVSIFDNHSIDLIYARPHQQLKTWEQELTQAVRFGLKHISLYQLTIEDKTVFAKRGIKALEETAAAEMYSFTCDFLNHNGYPQYEVSNFGRPSLHNCGYWQGEDYIGIGRGAHGRIHIREQLYGTTYPQQLEAISSEERAEELIIMGLRLLEGINKKRFRRQCGLELNDFVNWEKLQSFLNAGLLKDSGTDLSPTAAGLLVLNKIIEELCCP